MREINARLLALKTFADTKIKALPVYGAYHDNAL